MRGNCPFGEAESDSAVNCPYAESGSAVNCPLGRISGEAIIKRDIDAMANELDVASDTKTKLKQALKKFSTTLFSGGLGTLKCKPVAIEVGKDAIAFA